MPRGQVDYSKALIYKITCLDPKIKDIYVGSTTSFRHRKSCHKIGCENPNNNHYNLYKSQFIREHGGWDNWEMILVEEYPTTSLRELQKREEELRKELGATLNTIRAYVTEEESKERQKEYDAKKIQDPEWREDYNRKRNERRANNPEFREKENGKLREKRAIKAVNETPEDRKKRLEERNGKLREKTANETPEEKKKRRAKRRERMANQTPEEKEKRRKKAREGYHRRKAEKEALKQQENNVNNI